MKIFFAMFWVLVEYMAIRPILAPVKTFKCRRDRKSGSHSFMDDQAVLSPN